METTICSGPFGMSPKLVCLFASAFPRRAGATLALRALAREAHTTRRTIRRGSPPRARRHALNCRRDQSKPWPPPARRPRASNYGGQFQARAFPRISARHSPDVAFSRGRAAPSRLFCRYAEYPTSIDGCADLVNKSGSNYLPCKEHTRRQSFSRPPPVEANGRGNSVTFLAGSAVGICDRGALRRRQF